MLEERHRKIIQGILAKYPFDFYLFGSRAKNKAQKFSDVDLYFLEPMTASMFSQLEEDFESSDLPFKVDLVDFQSCDEDFRKRISEHAICIQKVSL